MGRKSVRGQTQAGLPMLPPGEFIDKYIAEVAMMGEPAPAESQTTEKPLLNVDLEESFVRLVEAYGKKHGMAFHQAAEHLMDSCTREPQ